MKIIVDKEWLDRLTQLTDASLKAYWNQIYALVTEVMWAIEVLPDLKNVKEEAHKKQVKKWEWEAVEETKK